MQHIWLILNRASRAVGDDWEAKLVSALEARGASVAGTTDFPHDPLPTPETLTAAQVDVAVIAAGDGTINATARMLDDWPGKLLVLPGGTMNLLAKSLHGDASPEAIIAVVSDPPASRQLATIESGEHRAVVGAIVGPAASWVHAREAVRKSRWTRLRRAIRLAWLRSLSRSVHLYKGRQRSRGYRAVFIHPDGESLSVVKVRASGWTDGVRLGFTYLTGTWETARGVEVSCAAEIKIAEPRQTFALFDGEPVRLPPYAILRRGQTKLQFVTTL